MRRRVLATLAASALFLNNWSAAAAPGLVSTDAAGTAAPAHNHSVLAPGGPAGIKKAQGIESDRYWLEAGLVIGAFVIVGLLMGIHEGSDDSGTTTGPVTTSK
jgi:hypothetical protein